MDVVSLDSAELSWPIRHALILQLTGRKDILSGTSTPLAGEGAHPIGLDMLGRLAPGHSRRCTAARRSNPPLGHQDREGPQRVGSGCSANNEADVDANLPCYDR